MPEPLSASGRSCWIRRAGHLFSFHFHCSHFLLDEKDLTLTTLGILKSGAAQKRSTAPGERFHTCSVIQLQNVYIDISLTQNLIELKPAETPRMPVKT